MTQIVLKNQIDESNLDTLYAVLTSWNVNVEIKEMPAKRAKKTRTESGEKHVLFSKTFGMWEGRDIDLKQIRQQAFERRTHTQMTKDGAL
jgi:hypothetical protein